MFESLRAAPADKILALMKHYADDPRPGKIDLGVGVYRDPSGKTPIIQAIREAERRLLLEQDTKSYLGPAGDPGFTVAIMRLILGTAADAGHTRVIQTPGGSGALRVVAELIKRTRPNAIVWVPDPTWANHSPILEGAGLQVAHYPYFSAATGAVHFEQMMTSLATARAGDVVLLHGCCHNPTGADLDALQWAEVADLLVDRGLLPFVDLAYQGFGDGLEADAAGLRKIAATVPEMVLAASCSKNFGVYRDRVGAAMLIAKSSSSADLAFGHLLATARSLYSMPPDHGAAAVRIVLNDTALRAAWVTELEGMRQRLKQLRSTFAEALRRRLNGGRFDVLAHHSGMFSRLGLSQAEVTRLRADHGIYMLADSRINIAGLQDTTLETLADAIASTIAGSSS